MLQLKVQYTHFTSALSLTGRGVHETVYRTISSLQVLRPCYEHNRTGKVHSLEYTGIQKVFNALRALITARQQRE
jgi:hypothetical protein